MQFQLPDNLKVQISAYDPTLKKRIRETAASDKPKRAKSTHPLGDIEPLIPAHIIPVQRQRAEINRINTEAVEDRYAVLYKPTDQGLQLKAILYHYESVWVAAWLPNPGEDYIYGVSYAFKEGVKASDIAISLNRQLKNGIDWEYKKFGRSEFRVATIYITRESLKNGDTQYLWNPKDVSSWKKKSIELHRNCIAPFTKQLESTLPTWEDANSIWERINPTYNNYYTLINRNTAWSFPSDINPLDWVPTVDYFLNANISQQVKYVFNTPFFKRWIQQQVNEITDKYKDPDNTKKVYIYAPANRIKHLADWINIIWQIYPDVPIDYLQNNLETLLSLNHLYTVNREQALPWLQQHMPVASFFQLLNKFVEKASENVSSYNFSTSNQRYQYRFSDLNDTINMLNTVLESGAEIKPPKRWRIEEFHDHVQAEAWKIRNPNQDLPQDLFPQPIKVQNWTFFQPRDIHQLGNWGRAVRNCVGNATHYAEGVKKKQHFIVLSMVDGDPRFTIQLKVNNGVMVVDQIADVSNKSLTIEQKEEYTAAFSAALNERNNELT